MTEEESKKKSGSSARPPAKKQKTDKSDDAKPEMKEDETKKDGVANGNGPEGASDESSDSGTDDVYEVEAVHGKRIHNGRVQYFLKWKGYPASQNSWEDEDNVFSKDLIEQWEEREKLKAAKKAAKGTAKGVPAAVRQANQRRRSDAGAEHFVPPQKVGFEYGDQIEEIRGARMKHGQLELCCKWVGKAETSFVPSTTANVRAPQAVIRFYESRVRFENPDDQPAVTSPK